MANDAAFRTSLVWLAGIVVVIGLYTHSLKKMTVTYIFGVFAIAGVLLPDWEFFDRDFSQWSSPVTFNNHSEPQSRHSPPMPPARLRMYPVRLVVYTAVYSFASYKWWRFITS